ncbi:MAG: hypothetical protein K2Y05_05010 [Hyphomicrobiaceae bacterium]|nr:hypothetical protein [Hyphomicrobiaceae bacterium]
MALSRWQLLWCSDYAQFYIVDSRDPIVPGIEDVDEADSQRGFKQSPQGLAVYTADCLKQIIEIEVLDADGDIFADQRDPPSAPPGVTIKSATTTVSFPSGAFVLSSPSRSGAEHMAPRFPVTPGHHTVTIRWAEHEASRYDTDDAAPFDVITVRIAPVP